MSNVERSIIKSIEEAIKTIFPDCCDRVLPSLYLEVPKDKKFGDFSTNIAMRLSREMKKSPMELATIVFDEIEKNPALPEVVRDIKIEKPGFINFYLSNIAVISAIAEIFRQGDGFGKVPLGKGKSVQIEFVSANPTGPLTIAHGRQAAVGDSLARILQFCGYKVTREYYINDEGVQMNILALSVKARVMELMGDEYEFPENGYKGLYIYDIAKEIASNKDKKALSDDFIIEYAYKSIMEAIKKDLMDFGVEFDVWFSQKKLFSSGKLKKALSILRDKGFLYEKDGATWFASTKFGDDKDRVVMKSDGSLTYLASDIAYHKEKFGKGYKWVIDIWGPDHHGYINRLTAACQALGYSKDALSILICQLVTLYRDKKPVRMSTRGGEFVTLREVMDEVGKDAARFFFIMRRTDSHLDFDLELAKAKTMDNPVYYIQYAHARIASVLKFAGESCSRGLNLDYRISSLKGIDLHLLDKPEEIDIIKILMQYPKIIESSVRNLEPYILLSYLQDLARIFHFYYDSYRIVTDDDSLTKARLLLIGVVQMILFSGLTLLGVATPEKM
ncbi:MAG: arginine--tRNA ligase [Candidatus Omnitrophica bacterium]|nr:arginine--tRNA ligase [Candidatus Omnitrophota bacterium]